MVISEERRVGKECEDEAGPDPYARAEHSFSDAIDQENRTTPQKHRNETSHGKESSVFVRASAKKRLAPGPRDVPAPLSDEQGNFNQEMLQRSPMKVRDIEIQGLGANSSETPQKVVFVHVIGDPHPGQGPGGLRIVDRDTPIQPSHSKAQCQQEDSAEQQCSLLLRNGRAPAGAEQQYHQAGQQ